ncbi:YcnI family protein [Agromyces sp. NPDC056523]|uniref:YcnI family copper-binding membrane protein n=1 Tax=Agromyces sp. NPDC056523 TaxID=3345850 RepID=UPI00366E4E3A
MRPITRTTAVVATALGAGTLLALAAPVAAQAHVTVTPGSTAAGSYTVLEFASGHGCDDSPTTSFTVDIPEQVASVRPTVEAGWSVEKVMIELDEPVEGADADEASERVRQVVYTADTPIPDGYRGTFEIQVLLPEDGEGERLEFPVLQSCVEGEIDWSESPGADGAEPELPAPAIEVTAPEGDGHGHGDDAADTTDAAETTAATEDPADAAVDTLARVVGIGGLAVGVAGLIVAIMARRGSKA